MSDDFKVDGNTQYVWSHFVNGGLCGMIILLHIRGLDLDNQLAVIRTADYELMDIARNNVNARSVMSSQSHTEREDNYHRHNVRTRISRYGFARVCETNEREKSRDQHFDR